MSMTPWIKSSMKALERWMDDVNREWRHPAYTLEDGETYQVTHPVSGVRTFKVQIDAHGLPFLAFMKADGTLRPRITTDMVSNAEWGSLKKVESMLIVFPANDVPVADSGCEHLAAGMAI